MDWKSAEGESGKPLQPQRRWFELGRRGLKSTGEKERTWHRNVLVNLASRWKNGIDNELQDFYWNHSKGSGAIYSDRDVTGPGKQYRAPAVPQKEHYWLLHAFYLHRFCSLACLGNLPGFVSTDYPISCLALPATCIIQTLPYSNFSLCHPLWPTVCTENPAKLVLLYLNLISR